MLKGHDLSTQATSEQLQMVDLLFTDNQAWDTGETAFWLGILPKALPYRKDLDAMYNLVSQNSRTRDQSLRQDLERLRRPDLTNDSLPERQEGQRQVPQSLSTFIFETPRGQGDRKRTNVVAPSGS